jgi:hypothetical protein
MGRPTAPIDDAAVLDDRRLDDDAIIDDRRKSVKDRRLSPRTKTLRGAKIFWPSGAVVTWTGAAAAECVIRNISETGAKIEAHSPVPETFELVCNLNKSRHSCRVQWRKGPMIGVKFV